MWLNSRGGTVLHLACSVICFAAVCHNVMKFFQVDPVAPLLNQILSKTVHQLVSKARLCLCRNLQLVDMLCISGTSEVLV